MKFQVVIEETLSKTICIEAECEHDALLIAKKMWRDGEVILDADDFSGVDFSEVD